MKIFLYYGFVKMKPYDYFSDIFQEKDFTHEEYEGQLPEKELFLLEDRHVENMEVSLRDTINHGIGSEEKSL